MAQYLFLIYESEAGYADGGQEVYGEVMTEHQNFAKDLEASGAKLLGGEALQPTATATSIRDRGATVTDGPFAETKEALGGFYLVECEDLDQALAIGKMVPARFGGVEVRPVMKFE